MQTIKGVWTGCQRRHCKAHGLLRSVHVRFRLCNCIHADIKRFETLWLKALYKNYLLSLLLFGLLLISMQILALFLRNCVWLFQVNFSRLNLSKPTFLEHTVKRKNKEKTFFKHLLKIKKKTKCRPETWLTYAPSFSHLAATGPIHCSTRSRVINIRLIVNFHENSCFIFNKLCSHFPNLNFSKR